MKLSILSQGQRKIPEITKAIVQIVPENCIITNRNKTDISKNDKGEGLDLLLWDVLS